MPFKLPVSPLPQNNACQWENNKDINLGFLSFLKFLLRTCYIHDTIKASLPWTALSLTQGHQLIQFCNSSAVQIIRTNQP